MVGEDRQLIVTVQPPNQVQYTFVDGFIGAVALAKFIDYPVRFKPQRRADGIPEFCCGDAADQCIPPGLTFEHNLVDRPGCQPQVALIGAKQGDRFLG